MCDLSDTEETECNFTQLTVEDRSEAAKKQFLLMFGLGTISEVLHAVDKQKQSVPAIVNTKQRSMMRRETLRLGGQPLPELSYRLLSKPNLDSLSAVSRSAEKSLQHQRQRKKQRIRKLLPTATSSSPLRHSSSPLPHSPSLLPHSSPFSSPSTTNTSSSPTSMPIDLCMHGPVMEPTSVEVLPCLSPSPIIRYPPAPLPPPPPFVPHRSPLFAPSPTTMPYPMCAFFKGGSLQTSAGTYKYRATGCFQCPICLRSMARADILKRHHGVHKGIRPYLCPHPGCHKNFKRKDHLQRHVKACHRLSRSRVV